MHTRAAVLLLLLTGCASESAPRETPETPSATAESAAAPTRQSSIPWEGVFTDATRVASVTFTATGYQVSYEDNSVPGWSGAYAGTGREHDGALLSTLPDAMATELRLTFDGEQTELLQLTTTRKGHENPRTHPLTRVDGDARKRARALYEEAFPNKTVAFPKRRAKLLAEAGIEAQSAGSVPKAAQLFEAAAVLYRPLTANVANALHRKAGCSQPTTNPQGSWELAADLYAEAARLAGEAGKTANQALSLYSQANCLNPKQNPKGSYERASALYDRSAALFETEGRDTNREKALAAHAALLHTWAWSRQPDRSDDPLTWEKVAELYTQASQLCARANDRAGQARSLNNLAVSVSPTSNHEGTWSRSAAIHAEAAIHYRAAGDTDAWRASLRQRAVCLWQDGKDRMGHGGHAREAHDLFRKAHSQAKTAGAAELTTKIESWLEMTRLTLDQESN